MVSLRNQKLGPRELRNERKIEKPLIFIKSSLFVHRKSIKNIMENIHAGVKV